MLIILLSFQAVAQIYVGDDWVAVAEGTFRYYEDQAAEVIEEPKEVKD